MYGQIICHQSFKKLRILNIYYTANCTFTLFVPKLIININTTLLIQIHVGLSQLLSLHSTEIALHSKSFTFYDQNFI